MTLTRNKAIEYMVKMNKIIPKIVILLVVSWVAPPILMTIGTATNISVFSVVGVFLGFLSSILFYGLIFYLIIMFVKVETKTNEQTISNNETPTLKQEDDYPVDNTMPEINFQISEIQERKQFEKEIFAIEHPILSVLQNKIIPFLWMLTVLCIIAAVIIFLLNYNEIRLHF